MSRLPLLIASVLLLSASLSAQTRSDVAELTRLLNEFLAGASRNDAAIHDRFWAEDLIYTGSSGRRIGKADIMRNARSAPARKPEGPTTTYTAEDIRIQQYGDTAIVAFRLVAATEKDNSRGVANYLNTGTFLKRNGKWQAVSWQATRIPRAEEDAKKEVAEAQTAFHQAVLAADVKKLETLVDPSFVWTHQNGEQTAREQLLEQLRSGQMKYTRLETDRVTVSVYGDTAVVRGVSTGKRRPGSDSGGSGDSTPFTTFYTLTFVNGGSDWRAVAMHTSRP